MSSWGSTEKACYALYRCAFEMHEGGQDLVRFFSRLMVMNMHDVTQCEAIARAQNAVVTLVVDGHAMIGADHTRDIAYLTKSPITQAEIDERTTLLCMAAAMVETEDF